MNPPIEWLEERDQQGAYIPPWFSPLTYEINVEEAK
jgi:hypothetical protein